MHSTAVNPMASSIPSTPPSAESSRRRPLIALREISKSFPVAGGEFTALDRISLELPSGEFVAIVGKSGSGKSTLLNLLAGIDRPSSGEIRIADTASARWTRALRVVARAQRGRRVPVLPALAHDDHRREHHAADGFLPDPSADQGARAGDGASRSSGGRRPGPKASWGAVRRPTTAGGHRPRPGERPAPHRRGRADWKPRLADGGRRPGAAGATHGNGEDRAHGHP